MPHHRILNRWTNACLWEGEATDKRDAVVKARAGGADLRVANLSDANLSGADLEWNSHDVISELLRRAAGENIVKRKIAGLILVSRDWCWDKFLAIAEDDPQAEWVFAELRKYVVDGDNAPGVLRKPATEMKP